MPFTHKYITAADYHAAVSLLQYGDVLICRTRGELTNLVIPGVYTHTAIYTGPSTITEAVGKDGVSCKDLIEFMLKKDRICILRSLFATEAERYQAAVEAQKLLGSPYDYELRSDNQAYYCSEMAWYAYKKACGSMPFTMRERFGQLTIAPDDFVNATTKWTIVWESNKFKV